MGKKRTAHSSVSEVQPTRMLSLAKSVASVESERRCSFTARLSASGTISKKRSEDPYRADQQPLVPSSISGDQGEPSTLSLALMSFFGTGKAIGAKETFGTDEAAGIYRSIGTDI